MLTSSTAAIYIMMWRSDGKTPPRKGKTIFWNKRAIYNETKYIIGLVRQN
jgi:hypothetical protein